MTRTAGDDAPPRRQKSVRLGYPVDASGRSCNFFVGRLNVPRYEVTVQGRGIVVPIDTSLAVGFLRIVQVRAGDPVEAEVRAVEVVGSEWSSSSYAFKNRGGTPYLTIMRIGLLSWWHRFLGAPSGYMFFAEDGVVMPSDNRFG